MKVLIISLPRTGSSSLLEKISKEQNLKYIFEPFDGTNRWKYNPNETNIVVKSLIFDKNENYNNNIKFYLDLSKEFNKIILLTRKDLKACAESWAYYRFIKDKTGKNLNEKYHWEKTDNFDEMYKKIIQWNSELLELSNLLKVNVTYYEDIFDINSKEKYRSKIDGKEIKTII